MNYRKIIWEYSSDSR